MAKFKIKFGNYYPTDICFGPIEFRPMAPGGARILGYLWLRDSISILNRSGQRGLFNYYLDIDACNEYINLYKSKIEEILRNSDK